MKKPVLSLLTVGHSPRLDLSNEMIPLLLDKFDVHENGVMDNYDSKQVRSLFNPIQGESSLVSRLNDGEMAHMSAEKVIPLVQESISSEQKKGTDIVILMCTNRFPDFESKVPLIIPYTIFHKLIPITMPNSKIGILFPFMSHLETMRTAWKADGVDVIDAFLPSDASLEHINEVISKFIKNEVDVIFMDCIGYTVEMKNIIREAINKPVIHPKSFIASIANSIF